MSQKIRLRVSPAVGLFVGPGVNAEEKLRGVSAAADMPVVERVSLLFCMMQEADGRVRTAASAAFATLPVESVLDFIATPDAHPAVLDFLARFHHSTPQIATALLESPGLSARAREFLSKAVPPVAGIRQEQGVDRGAGDLESDADMSEGEKVPGDEEPKTAVDESEVSEEGEEFLNKYRLAQQMGVGEKIKTALTGDKEWRAILIKDTNKLVSGSVIKNPRLTEGEVLTILKAGLQNDEVIRLICANKDWVKNYKIRKALVENPKTPLPNALRYLASMGEKDIAAYAKSKNISSVLSSQAKRIILAKGN
ncbi:hypothetical protein [Geobacter sp. SVR]|uniref:hypothetical protein n=1 Tax=Geobacter sp. SVR TaxID=2495594 RepID=UPI00143F0500|nr:hypothetical protein [Geobacter sp. SVR]BCS53034.1 hypothetical protein GSVR_13420 [Geobacter sp. SVR]GCF84419.1 hypothetical protein GSbR_10190 [Geobacter sp. SVR]